MKAVYFTDVRGQDAVLDVLRREGLNPQVVEDVNPYSMQAGGWTARVTVAVPADEAEQAARILAEWDADRSQNVKALGRQSTGCVARIVALVIGTLLLLFVEPRPASWLELVMLVLILAFVVVVVLRPSTPGDAPPPGDGWTDNAAPDEDKPPAPPKQAE